MKVLVYHPVKFFFSRTILMLPSIEGKNLLFATNAYLFIAVTILCFLFCCCLIGVIGSGHFCSERGFSSVVQELANKLVPCTRRLWQLTKVLKR